MKEDIRHLVRLQSIEFEIRDLQRKQREAPERIAELEQAFQERLEEIGGERLRHESLVEERRKLCEEREALNQRVETAQKKLMQVSNQREYSAVLNEIDTTKARFSEIERAIGSHDSEIEELAGLSDPAHEPEIGNLRSQLHEVRKSIYGALDPWQKTLVARHPLRPYTLDFVRELTTDFVELHGDRSNRDGIGTMVHLEAGGEGRQVRLRGAEMHAASQDQAA